jgi:hypothetical protein
MHITFEQLMGMIESSEGENSAWSDMKLQELQIKWPYP